ncbi:unnamed protein product [Vicia faba]|uniref:Uncharacterized protein n=1 Tax=Vicia faba TaxID=3906 RepID=A0AAV0YT66_VICFA|nr:unnamed protein product [Vicia faba]
MEGLSGESLSDEVISRGSPETLFSAKSDEGENLVERPMPSHVLTMVEIEAACQRGECASRFVRTYREVTVHDSSDNEISRHMEFQGQYDVVS